MIHTILIADDSSTARMVTRRCLEIAGYHEAEFLSAKDGQEALEIIKKQQVDLLVTDLNMPNMDGGVLLKFIKASPRFNELPVLVISSMGNQAKQEELLQHGAFAVLCKPISPADILQVMQSLEPEKTEV
jgi:two-component system, chemotaxis family, chemotaxis protein CheY